MRKNLYLYCLCFLLGHCMLFETGCGYLFIKAYESSFDIQKKSKIKDTGSISVTSTPSEAEVILDGEVKGVTPMKLSLANNHSALHEKELSIVKKGYQTKFFILTPDKVKDKSTTNKGLFLAGIAEIIAGTLCIPLTINMKFYEKNKEEVKNIAEILLMSGILDMVVSLASGRPLIVRSFNKNINAELENEKAYIDRIEKERIQQELDFNAKKERDKNEMEKRIKQELVARQRADQRRQEQLALSKQEFSQVKKGDLICLKDPDCIYGDACLKVSAFVENWNDDRSNYQIRISAINTNGVAYTDGIGPYGDFDGVRYHVQNIIWISPYDHQNLIWVRCSQH